MHGGDTGHKGLMPGVTYCVVIGGMPDEEENSDSDSKEQSDSDSEEQSDSE